MTLLTLLGAATTTVADGSAAIPAGSGATAATGSKGAAGTASATITASSATAASGGLLASGSADVVAAISTLSTPTGVRGGIGVIDIAATGTPSDAAGERGPGQGTANATGAATINNPGRKGGKGTSAISALQIVDRSAIKAAGGTADATAGQASTGSGVLGGSGAADTTVSAILATSGSKAVAGSADAQATGDGAGSGGQDRSGTADVGPVSSTTALVGRKRGKGTADPVTGNSDVSDSGEMPAGSVVHDENVTAADGTKFATGTAGSIAGHASLSGKGGRSGVVGAAATTASSGTGTGGQQGRFGGVGLPAVAGYLTASGGKAGARGTAQVSTPSRVDPAKGKKRMAAPFVVTDQAIIGNPGYAAHHGAAAGLPLGQDVAAAGLVVVLGDAELDTTAATASVGAKTIAGTGDGVAGATVAVAGGRDASGSSNLTSRSVMRVRAEGDPAPGRQLAATGVG